MRMRDEVKFISVDMGNSAAKVCELGPDGRIRNKIYPNIAGEAKKLKFPPGGEDDNCLSVKVLTANEPEYREEFFIGKLAQRELQDNADQDTDRNKAESYGINIITPTILGLHSNDIPMVLCTGATFQDFSDQSPRLKDKLTGRHKVWFRYGTHANDSVDAHVIKTYTFPQLGAGLIGMLRDDQGRPRRDDWDNKTVLGLDFGHGQVHYGILQNMEFIQSSCKSTDFGCAGIVSAVQDYLNTKYYVCASIPQLQEAVERGYYMQHNQKIDLTEVIDEAQNEIMDQLYRALTNPKNISKALFDSINEVVIMGGRGAKMVPFVGSRFEHIKPEVSQNYLEENARGMLLIAQDKWRIENGLR
jgi:hypothetical protein